MDVAPHPLVTDQDFIKQVDATPRAADRLDLWWLGQSGFLVQWNNTRLLVDPYLSDSLTSKYAHTERPHVRITPRLFDPALLNHITHVFATHFHSDSLDTHTLSPIITRFPDLIFIGPRAIQETIIERLGRPADVLLSDGESVDLDNDLTVHAILADHDTTALRDVQNNALFLGYIIRLGPFHLYHAGDTIDYEQLASNVASISVSIDVAMLPINATHAGQFVAMDAVAAAHLASKLKPRVALPMHFGLFAHTVADPDAFHANCVTLGVASRSLVIGGHVTLQSNP
jgi:L-ascorbate metabolism protein UlaG (beta-lactamase superfamily)